MTLALVLSGLSGRVAAGHCRVRVGQAIYFFSFLSGGVAYAVGFGLLVAGVSVTSYFTLYLPRWLVAFGMIVAVAGEFSLIVIRGYFAET